MFHRGGNVHRQHPFAVEGFVGFCFDLLVVLVLVVGCILSSCSSSAYYFGYWALFEEVVHLGKDIGHVVRCMQDCE